MARRLNYRLTYLGMFLSVIMCVYLLSSSNENIVGRETVQQSKNAKYVQVQAIQAPKINEGEMAGKNMQKGDLGPAVNGVSNLKDRIRVQDLSEIVIDKFDCVPLKTAVGETKICIFDPKIDNWLSRGFAENGTYQPHLVQSFEMFLEKDRDLNVIDIGANLGEFTIIGAIRNRKVVSVEPLNDTVKRLIRGIQINGLEKQVTLVTNPISNEYADVTLRLYYTNMASSSLVDVKKKQKGVKYANQVSQTILMDDLIHVIPFKYAILKIDIEGFELNAFAKSDKLFKEIDIPVVMMEWVHVRWKKDSTHFVRKMRVERGYIPFVFPNRGGQLGDIQTDNRWQSVDDIFWIRKDYLLKNFAGIFTE